MRNKTHLRATAPYRHKYKGLILAKDFKTIADFKSCCRLLKWSVQTAHFQIRHDEESNQEIISDFYNSSI